MPPMAPTTAPAMVPPDTPLESESEEGDGLPVLEVDGDADVEAEEAGVELAEAEEGVLVAVRAAMSRVQEVAWGRAELREEKVAFTLSEETFATGFADVAQQMFIWSGWGC